MKYLVVIVTCVLFTSRMYSQNPGDRFVNSNCEQIYFLSDSIIEFMVVGDNVGAIGILYHGIGYYNIDNNQLLIKITNAGLYDKEHKGTMIDNNCNEFKNKTSGTYTFVIEKQSDGFIKLTGPILDNYKKLNRKRYFKGFINWPWRWSFKKQHWYDPRTRILQLS
jgi:hypothetical protein